MPIFSPRRSQLPLYPYQRDPFFVRIFTAIERMIKSLLFGCRMCGRCILEETAFICPMTCPKGLRNGPCGGSTPEHCYVDETRPCTWYKIYQRAERINRLHRLLAIQAPIDGRLSGHSSWISLFKHWRKHPLGLHFRDIFSRKKLKQAWKPFLYAYEQPIWWQGDAAYHAPAYDEPISNLERSLHSGHFTITAEITPPLSVTRKNLQRKINLLRDFMAAANYTDNASSIPRMSSLACAAISVENGLEPVMQLQARDRDRYAIQADAIGAAALNITNVLCLSGDHLNLGPDPTPYPLQNDIDSIQMLWMLRRMRDDGIYLDKREIKDQPKLFLGAAASPHAAIPRYEAIREEKKVNAGAQFLQTQPIFDYNRFLEWLEAVDKRNILDKVYILAGITPLKSPRMTFHLAEEVPGVVIPQNFIKRMNEASDPQEEGVAIALETIEKLKNTPGINGIHFMAIYWEDIVPRLILESGLPLPQKHTVIAPNEQAEA